MAAINAQSDTWTASNSFQFESDFVTQLKKPETGHFTWKWSGPALWEQDTSLANYHQVTVRQADQLYTARTLAYSPLAVREILQLLRPHPVRLSDWKVEKVKQAEHGSEYCAELRSTSSTSDREIFLNAGTKEVISDEIRSVGEVRRREFSDYQPFLGRPFPRKLKLILNGTPLLTVVVTLLEERSYAAADFVPPANAVVRRTCENIVPPKVLYDPSPGYPQAKTAKHVNGTSIVSLTVLPDGSVDDVYLIGSSNREMDEASQQIVKTWKFKPAMCGSEPVATDISVQVNFRTYQALNPSSAVSLGG
jgi:TonB family protein